MIDVCEERCNQEDPNARKLCDCLDLFMCVRQLKYNDYAVMFSRGLVDESTGTIEIEKENVDNSRLWREGDSVLDEDGNLVKEANTAAEDIFDAEALLNKINRIQGLAMPVAGNSAKNENCDALLSEFHVPCKDWRNGCSGSDGRSYRMVRIGLSVIDYLLVLEIISYHHYQSLPIATEHRRDMRCHR